MDNKLGITIGLLAAIGTGIAFMSVSRTESTSNQTIDSGQTNSNEIPPLTGNPYQDTRIVGGKRSKKKKKSRRKGQ